MSRYLSSTRRRVGSGLSLALAAILLHLACGRQAAETGGPKPPLVKTAVAQLGTIRQELELPGTVRPSAVAGVLSTTEGKVSRLLAREGDRVEEGTALAYVSPLVREDIVNAARVAAESLRAIGRQPLAEAEENLRFALAEYRESPLVAPMTGVVSQRSADIGDMVVPRQKLYEVQSVGAFRVDVTVPELSISGVGRGANVRLRADAWPDREFNGRVERVHPRLDELTRTGMVEIVPQPPFPELKAGMMVRVSIATAQADSAVIVPVAAVTVTPNGQQVVYVVDADTARQRQVRTGIESGSRVQLLDGVAAGESVITAGNERLRDGAAVRVQSGKAGAPGRED
ncbi:MAG: efflux RND transporter periplasmic adaptor subunit [bacterium]